MHRWSCSASQQPAHLHDIIYTHVPLLQMQAALPVRVSKIFESAAPPIMRSPATRNSVHKADCSCHPRCGYPLRQPCACMTISNRPTWMQGLPGVKEWHVRWFYRRTRSRKAAPRHSRAHFSSRREAAALVLPPADWTRRLRPAALRRSKPLKGHDARRVHHVRAAQHGQAALLRRLLGPLLGAPPQACGNGCGGTSSGRAPCLRPATLSLLPHQAAQADGTVDLVPAARPGQDDVPVHGQAPCLACLLVAAPQPPPAGETRGWHHAAHAARQGPLTFTGLGHQVCHVGGLPPRAGQGLLGCPG